ncbi:hypothetical protein DFH11DRAFT_1593865 [Phellopilus nigrolimitatus]|nr:hypothetical protein DFH11DRAFT_1593865 [Phellopilus nigrolimitatus]
MPMPMPLPLGTFDFDALPPVLEEKGDFLDSPGSAGAGPCEKSAPRRRRRVGGSRTRLAALFRAVAAPLRLPAFFAAAAPGPSSCPRRASPSPSHPWLASCERARGTPAWRARVASEQRVGAFGPVTRVLEPVVARAQWEIVVRAAAVAALASAVLAGALVALPVVPPARG